MTEQQQDIPSLISSFLGSPAEKNELNKEATVMMPPRDDRSIRTNIVNDIETTPQIIKGWKPSTTNSLFIPPSVIGACDVIDHTFGKAFAQSLQMELETNNIHQKLEPAKTAQDLQTNDLMQKFSAFTGNTSNGRSSVRQDFSSIVPRSFRKMPAFRTKYPHLQKMISSIEQTALHYLVDKKQNSFGNVDINLDLSLTSVQIAKYEGDGKSGYKRLDCNFEEHYSHHDVKTSCTNSGGHYTAYNVVASGDRDGIPIDISLKNMPFCMGLNCEDVKSIIPDESSSLNGIDSLSIEARSSSDSDTIGPTTNVDDASTRIIAKSFFLLHSTIALFLFW